LEEPEKGTELSTSGVGRGGRGDVTVLVASLCACPGELIFLDKGWDGMGREGKGREGRPVAERAGRICDKKNEFKPNAEPRAHRSHGLPSDSHYFLLGKGVIFFFIVQQQLQRCKKKKKITADQSPLYNM
jgi:hypothetical protein